MSPHLVAHPGPIPAQAGIGLRFQHHQAVLDVRPLAEHLAARRFVDFRLAPLEPAQRWGGTAMTDVAADKPSRPLALLERAVGLLDGVPYTLQALPLRAVAGSDHKKWSQQASTPRLAFGPTLSWNTHSCNFARRSAAR